MKIIDEMLRPKSCNTEPEMVLASLRGAHSPDELYMTLVGMMQDQRELADIVRGNCKVLIDAGMDEQACADLMGCAIQFGASDSIRLLVAAALALDGPQKATGLVS